MKTDFNQFSENYINILNDNIKQFSQYSGEYYQDYKVNYTFNLCKRNSLNPKEILDFGCGIGIGCKKLKEQFYNSKVIGIDISQKSIEIAQNSYRHMDIDFKCYDGLNVPYENKFDLIYTSCVFHHIPPKYHAKIIDELYKALKINGIICIFEHNPINPLTRKVFNDCIFDKDAKLIYPNEFKKIINGSLNYLFFIPRFKSLEPLFNIEKYLHKVPIGAQYCYVIKRQL